MKNFKKVLCLALSIIMILSCGAVFATSFSDVPAAAKYTDAVSALNQLGILKGYEDGTFKPEKTVTRAEFTAMLMRTMGLGNVGPTTAVAAALPFEDVTDENTDISWAIPNISTAFGMQIVNGFDETTFKPSDNVAFEEAFKMIVCALGYKNVSVDADPWYSNYMAIANKTGIIRDASALGGVGQPATRACIAQMLYDSLEVGVIENDKLTEKTFLTDFLHYVKNTGYIAANDVTSLASPDVNLKENQIQIRAKEPDTNVYSIHTYSTADAAMFKDKLGHQVEFFYANNNEDIRTLFSCEFKGNASIEITSKSIDTDETTDSQIKYFKENAKKNTTAPLANDNIVIYNGKLAGSNESNSSFDTSMIPEVGTISLLDANTDGQYDIINIYSYDVYYVSSRSTADFSIVDSKTKGPTEQKSVILDVDDSATNLTIVNQEGKVIPFSSIAVGNVVCLASSKDNGGQLLQKAVVVTATKDGAITARATGESVSFGDKKFNFSPASSWMKYGDGQGLQDEPKVGDSGKYVLDILGDIVAYEQSQVTENQFYGYVMAYNRPTNEDDFQVEILPQNSTSKASQYYIYRGTKIDGVVCSDPAQVVEALEDAAKKTNSDLSDKSGIVSQLVKYTTKEYKGKTCIGEILTATGVAGGANVENSVLNYNKNVSAATPMKYTNNKLSANGIEVGLGSDTIVFSVPTDRSDRKDYKKASVSSSFRNDKSYKVEVFDMSTSKNAKVVVLYGSSAATAVDSASPIYVVSEKGEKNNTVEDEIMTFIKGTKFAPRSSAATFEDWVSPESRSAARNIEAGSIFRAGLDDSGFTKVSENHILFPAAAGYLKSEDYKDTAATWDEAEFTAIYGSVYTSNVEDNVVLVPTVLQKGETTTNDAKYKQHVIPVSNIASNAKVLRYDIQNNTTTITDKTEDYKNVIGSLTQYTNGETTPSEVFVYMSEGKVRLFVQIVRK
ncbi:MAG: S-layer homology domain-containing protein [Oscillospiraceae bacterium]